MSHSRVVELCQRSYQEKTGSVGELEYLLVEDEGMNYLVFRGTEAWPPFPNAWDLIRDLRIWPWPIRVGDQNLRGHAGFIRGAERAASAVLPDLPAGPLTVAGHSLGGAVALVAGMLLAHKREVTEIVTLGAPHVFWHKPSIPEQTRLTMYRKGRDLVTYVPLGRHPVKLTKIGKPERFWPNLGDHGVDQYAQEIN